MEKADANNMKTGNKGHVARLLPAIKNSWAGLKAAFQNEIAFKQEVYLAIIMLPLAWFLADGFIEFAVLLSPIVVILVAELLNSGIEAVVDRVGTEHHELSGLAKDLGSAAVFIAIVYFVMVWLYKILVVFGVIS